jgi:site-specific DNA recombinase
LHDHGNSILSLPAYRDTPIPIRLESPFSLQERWRSYAHLIVTKTRLPAHEIESRVTERLLAFLKSDAEIFDGLSYLDESPTAIQPLVTAAKKLATRLSSLRSNELRDLMASFLRKVIVQENAIQLLISGTSLRKVLNGDDVELARGPVDNDLVCLTIEAKRKRCGGEVHLVVPPNSSSSVRHPRTSLIKAVARSRAWYEKVLEGGASNLRSLAREAGLTPHYVRNVFACAFLAPDIVEAILEGRQPLTLKFEHLYKQIPLSWAEQRRQFGFPENPRPEQSPSCNRS